MICAKNLSNIVPIRTMMTPTVGLNLWAWALLHRSVEQVHMQPGIPSGGTPLHFPVSKSFWQTGELLIFVLLLHVNIACAGTTPNVPRFDSDANHLDSLMATYITTCQKYLSCAFWRRCQNQVHLYHSRRFPWAYPWVGTLGNPCST